MSSDTQAKNKLMSAGAVTRNAITSDAATKVDKGSVLGVAIHNRVEQALEAYNVEQVSSAA